MDYTTTFMMEVDIWADDMHKHPKYLKEEVIEWYKQLNYDKKNFKIKYIFNTCIIHNMPFLNIPNR